MPRLSPPDHEHEPHDDHGGLHRDLGATGDAIGRRRLLRLTLGAGALFLLGCSKDGIGVQSGTNNDETGSNPNCSKIPTETAGPYPGDGSNGPTVLSQTGVVRRDLRSSFAGLSGTAEGVLLTVTLQITSASACTPLAGRAVYLWHCDNAGRYSLYSSGVTNQNWLRGVQETDSEGKVTFTTIYPGCYSGRWPHIHFEVYPSLAAATNVANKIATSQLAFPKSTCQSVYATSGYESSVSNLAGVSLETDNVFSDGATTQLATMAGSVASGYTATLLVPI